MRNDQMKRIGAVAVALTAFAAAGASAQSGAVTVVTQPDLQTCVVSGVAAGGTGANVMIARSVAGERVAGEQNVVAFARTASSDGVARQLTVERQADGTTVVRDGDGNIIKPAEARNGVYEVRSKDGAAITVVGAEGGQGGHMVASVRSVEGVPVVAALRATDEAKVGGTTKESPKYHVKRPSTVKTVDGERAVAELAMTTAHAQLLAADGVALAKPVRCKVVLKESDGGN
jgi:hypothetical protein